MKLHLPQLSKSLDVDKGENLFKTFKNQEIPIASSCNGQGICGKCIVLVLQSQVPLPPEGHYETELKKRMGINPKYRLSCQLEVQGDMKIKTTYW